MSDKYAYLKKVFDKLHQCKYYESDFSTSDVEIAIRELNAICQTLPMLIPDTQRDIMRLLNAAQSRHLQEILKYKADGEEKFHNLLKEYQNYLQRQSVVPEFVFSNSPAGSTNSEYLNTSEDRETSFSMVGDQKRRDHHRPKIELSDLNTPEKIAEYFRDLYHREWTIAFKALKGMGQIRNEEEIIRRLGKMLEMAYELCREEARKHRGKITEALVYPLGLPAIANARVNHTTEQKLQPRVHQIQQETGLYAVPAVQEIFWYTHGGAFAETGWDKSKEIINYVESCVRICWLFSIQDPPMKLVWPEEGFKINDNMKEHSKHGKIVHFTVWPILQLYENGPLLSKGVVEPF
ncbi:uncharacterized protein LOC134274861 [Saccostrea cucullata]|uniref:uncharacterized protein LOC134274861 n=1 Tax=Saccostrea cuccullata TaxID=36930 RepID=UPI002ED1A3CF